MSGMYSGSLTLGRRTDQTEGTILALRAEVERLKQKINTVVSSAEVTLRDVQEDNDTVRLSFVKKEELYLRELNEKEREKEHYKNLYEVVRAEYDDEQKKGRETANMLKTLRESMIHRLGSTGGGGEGGAAETKTQDADWSEGLSNNYSSSKDILAHPGQLVMRSTSSWAIEVSKLRRISESQTAEMGSLQTKLTSLSRELEEHKVLLAASRSESVHSLAMLEEFRLAQTNLGRPRTRDQQLLSTIRAALDSTEAAHGAMLSRDLLASVNDEETIVAQHSALYQQGLQELLELWESEPASAVGLHVVLERLTEKLAEARAFLMEKADELERARSTLDQQIHDRETILQSLREEHAAAAHWAHEKASFESQLAEHGDVAKLREDLAALQTREQIFEEGAVALGVLNNEKVSMETKLRSVDAEVERLGIQLEASLKERAEMAEHALERESLLADISNQCDDIKRRNGVVETELRQTKDQARAAADKAFEDICVLEEALGAARVSARESSDSAEDYRRRLISLENEVEVQTQQWVDAKVALQTKRDEAKALSEEITRMRLELIPLKTENDAQKTKIEALANCIDTHHREMDDIKRKFAAVVTANAAHEHDKQELRDRLEHSEQEIALERTRLSEMAHKLTEAQNEAQTKHNALHNVTVEHVSEMFRFEESKNLEISSLTEKLIFAEAQNTELNRQARYDEDRWTERSETWIKERNDLIKKTDEMHAFIEHSGSINAGKVNEAQDALRECRRSEHESRLRLEQAVKETEALRLALKRNEEKLEILNLSQVEARTALEICQAQLDQKVDEVVQNFASKERVLAEQMLDRVQHEADMAAATQRVKEKEKEVEHLREKATKLQHEIDSLRPGIEMLLVESDQNERTRTQAEEAEQSFDKLRQEKEEMESHYRAEVDLANIRVAEMQGKFAAKEARLKDIIMFAKDNISKLEERDARHQSEMQSREAELRELHSREVHSLKSQLEQESRARKTAEADKEYSDRAEKAITEQLRKQQQRYHDMESKFQAKTIETSELMTKLSERMHSSELQAKFFERQAGFSSEEFRKRDNEIEALQKTINQHMEDLRESRKQQDALLLKLAQERERYLEDMDDLRDKHSYEMNKTCSAISLDFEKSTRDITNRLWDSEKARVALEETLGDKAAQLHAVKRDLGLCEKKLSTERQDRKTEKQEHDRLVEHIRSENATAVKAQLEAQASCHSAELSAALAVQRVEAERMVAELRRREATLVFASDESSRQMHSARQLALENAQLQAQYQEELSKNAHLSTELARVNAGFGDKSNELRNQLDEAAINLAHARSEKYALCATIAMMQEESDKARREELRLRDVMLSDHTHAIAEACRELEEKNSALSLGLAQTRNEMLVMLKKHAAELDAARESNTSSYHRSLQERESEMEALKRETREATDRWAQAQVNHAAQERLLKEQHERDLREVQAQVRVVEEQSLAHLSAMQAAEAARQETVAALTSTLRREAEFTISALQSKLTEADTRFQALRAKAETKAVEAERERSKLVDRAVTARRDQHAAMEAHERALSGALAAAEAQKLRELTAVREEVLAAQMQLQSQLQTEGTAHLQTRAKLEAEISSMKQALERAAKESEADQRLHAEVLAKNQLVIAEAREVRRALELDLEEKRRAVEQSTVKLSAAQEQLDSLRQRHADAVSELDLHSNTLQQRDGELADLRHRLSKHEIANRDFVASIAQMQRHVEEVEARDKLSLERIVAGQAEADRLSSSAAEASAAVLEAHKSQIEALRRQLKESRAEADALTKSMAESEARAQSAAEGFTRKISSLETRLHEWKATLEVRYLETPSDSSSARLVSPMKTGTRTADRLSPSEFLSPLRQRPFRHGGAVDSELDSRPNSPGTPPYIDPGFPPSAADALSSHHATEADVTIEEIKNSIAALEARSAIGSDATNDPHQLQMLIKSVECYETLKALHIQAEDEYNAAARILIDAAEGNRLKMVARVEHYQRKLEQVTSLYTKIKLKLVNERLEYREELESMRLRLLNADGNIAGDGDSFDSDDGDGSSEGSITFSIFTDTIED